MNASRHGNAIGQAMETTHSSSPSEYLAVWIAFRPVGKRYESFAFEQIGGFDLKFLVPEVTPLIRRIVVLDRFQMCAYAIAFNADRVTLVYPTLANGGVEHRPILNATVGGKEIVIDSIDLPMQSGPQSCKDALLQFLQEKTGFEAGVNPPVGSVHQSGG